jgi:putative phosphoesterase
MKIGVISDTHLEGPTPPLERVVENYFKDTDIILHAGDIHAMAVLDAFKGKRVHAVAGNRDRREVRERLPGKTVITVNGLRIGLTHGWGPPFWLEKRIAPLFEGIHCLVFGHSHWAVNHRNNGILYFNPGTFIGGIFSLWRPSIGLLTIDKDIQGEIIWL